MEPKMIVLEEKKMVGKSIRMTLAEDATQELWKSFMPHRQSIPDRVDERLYNLKVFDQGFDPKQFHPSTPFVKWAAVEVLPRTHNEDPGMETLVLKGGLYAVFLHRGPADRFNQTLQYIFEEWLPASAYDLDDRAHFERFTIDYHPADPEAVEEVWIPVKAVHE
ncbi:GyrI-like domain-containing protein [Halobacillus sp. HZG1]|uniref:GyrI-like domain-containing protein n=1 Tax=Halobacillus sp. HZG1 TaxID=3111769 RepID=UPI002DB71E07|nr:GyrI-like domain-containing protein [Halobacillus sp. HZG1]MEC3885350.1 GyrI-like domain-containing protein [Halobacillus sp. HZG1]